MRKIKLTKNKYALVDDRDYDFLSCFTWQATKGTKDVWYARRLKSEYMHRLVIGANKGEIVDHINGNGLDNRICNLRIVTKSQNNRNQTKRKDSSCLYKGIKKVTGCNLYEARIKIKGKETYLGCYKTQLGARRAYLKAVKNLERES